MILDQSTIRDFSILLRVVKYLSFNDDQMLNVKTPAWSHKLVYKVFQIENVSNCK